MKKLMAIVFAGGLLMGLIVIPITANEQPNEPVRTQTQTQPDECPDEQVAVRAMVKRQLMKGAHGRQVQEQKQLQQLGR